MPFARISHESHVILDTVETADGITIATSRGGKTFEEFEKAPTVVNFNGQKLGKTSWNSDHCRIVYRSDAKIATKGN